MVGLMNRSIDIMESLAHESENVFHLNRRGYLYVTGDSAKVASFTDRAARITSLGAGELRPHAGSHADYSPYSGDRLTGADLLLDPSLMRTGRLDYILRFPIPDEKARLEILRVHTQERPLAGDVDLQDLARSTEGMAGSQLASICRNATLLAITETIQAPPKKSSRRFLVRAAHFKEAIRSVQTKQGGILC